MVKIVPGFDLKNRMTEVKVVFVSSLTAAGFCLCCPALFSLVTLSVSCVNFQYNREKEADDPGHGGGVYNKWQVKEREMTARCFCFKKVNGLGAWGVNLGPSSLPGVLLTFSPNFLRKRMGNFAYNPYFQ